jgi:hypothetical protein
MPKNSANFAGVGFAESGNLFASPINKKDHIGNGNLNEISSFNMGLNRSNQKF